MQMLALHCASVYVLRYNILGTTVYTDSIRYSLSWPDPIFTQGRYRLQYKRPAQKGSGPVHRLDWNRDHHRGGGC